MCLCIHSATAKKPKNMIHLALPLTSIPMVVLKETKRFYNSGPSIMFQVAYCDIFHCTLFCSGSIWLRFDRRDNKLQSSEQEFSLVFSGIEDSFSLQGTTMFLSSNNQCHNNMQHNLTFFRLNSHHTHYTHTHTHTYTHTQNT